MVIRALDLVHQCVDHTDGLQIFNAIKSGLNASDLVIVSFDGVDAVPSSFVNTAFVQLLDIYTLQFIQSHLQIIDSTRQINGMIKDRLEYVNSVDHKEYA